MQRFLDLFISINCSTCFRRFFRPSSGAQNCTYSTQLRSISSTIAAGSSIGLTIPDAVCTVLCSWWWAQEPPETCRAIYRNKQIEKTLHLVGCTVKVHLRCTDIWTSKIPTVSTLWPLFPCCFSVVTSVTSKTDVIFTA